MLELIFAMVVIGITLLSAPQLVSTAAQSGYTALQQEAIAQAASDISLILTREWDESGTDASFQAPILDTSGNGGLAVRAGARSRSFYTSTGTRFTASFPLVSEGDDDIDDVASNALIKKQDAHIDSTDQSVAIAVSVDYITDAPSAGSAWDTSDTVSYYSPFASGSLNPGGSTSIKKINVILTDGSGTEELKKTISLSAFSCNIGSFRLNRRELP